mmetsp:Transcript_1858/g.6654  ORF Transcript_1858/g.6654 Transcript_1858/m.6654 type:complete len:81 (-) Transcript_1858:2486-2728(-)
MYSVKEAKEVPVVELGRVEKAQATAVDRNQAQGLAEAPDGARVTGAGLGLAVARELVLGKGHRQEWALKETGRVRVLELL